MRLFFTLILAIVETLLTMFGFGITGSSSHYVFGADGFSEADESEFAYLDPNTEGVY